MVLTRLDTASELKQLCTGRECEAQSQTATERLQKGSEKNVGTQFGSLIETEILKLFPCLLLIMVDRTPVFWMRNLPASC